MDYRSKEFMVKLCDVFAVESPKYAFFFKLIVISMYLLGIWKLK